MEPLKLLFAKIIEIYAVRLGKIETLQSIDTIIKSYHPYIQTGIFSSTTKNWRE